MAATSTPVHKSPSIVAVVSPPPLYVVVITAFFIDVHAQGRLSLANESY